MCSGRESGMSRDKVLLALLLVLTFTTGMIDAIGYLGLDRVFAGNMTGNVAILGIGISGAGELPVAGPGFALVGFLLGAVVGGRALRPNANAWSGRVSWSLLASATAVVGAALLVILLPGQPTGWPAILTTTVLSAAMGLQASVARHLAVSDVTTVVVTSTITGLAADSKLAGGASPRQGRRVLAIASVLLGALAGALLLQLGVGVSLLVTAAVMTVAIGFCNVALSRGLR